MLKNENQTFVGLNVHQYYVFKNLKRGVFYNIFMWDALLLS